MLNNVSSDRRRIEAEIDALLRGANSSTDEELQSSLARYLCVLASSYLEAAFREIVVAYTEPRADRHISQFVGRSIKWFTNPNMERILQLVGQFDVQYRKNLEEFCSGELKDSVDSIIANRNNISHGRTSGISLTQISAYYCNAKSVIGHARNVLEAEENHSGNAPTD